MSCAEYLRDLLRPLGVYDLNAPINGAALDAKGAVLDEVHNWLEELGRETDLTAAQDWGLETWRQLFGLSPVSREPEQLREAICALLRIGFGDCTLAAIRDTLSGCGLPTVVEEAGVGRVKVRFPGVAGQPEDFALLRATIEEILPAHVEVEYIFNCLTWELLESYNWTFSITDLLTWDRLEKSA